MRFADVMLSFPAILLGLALVAIFGHGALPVIIALSIATVPDSARIARSIAIGVMEQEYIEAGRAIGLSDRALFTRYLLRNSISAIMIFVSLRFGQIILIGAALSLAPGHAPGGELGMIPRRGATSCSLHIAIIPSLAIFVIVLAANIAAMRSATFWTRVCSPQDRPGNQGANEEKTEMTPHKAAPQPPSRPSPPRSQRRN